MKSLYSLIFVLVCLVLHDLKKNQVICTRSSRVLYEGVICHTDVPLGRLAALKKSHDIAEGVKFHLPDNMKVVFKSSETTDGHDDDVQDQTLINKN